MRREGLIILLSIVLLSGCSLFQKSEPVAAIPLSTCAPTTGDKPISTAMPTLTSPVAAKDLDTLREKIQGKTPEQVYNIIVSLLGEPDRDTGSGLSIPQWDIAGGVLTFHPLMGPSFRDENGAVVWLLVTENAAGRNILGSYEMSTAPGLYGSDTQYWIGNLELHTDGTYEFIDSGQNPDKRGYQEDNFLINNPRGRFSITYPPGITESTLLESLEDHTLLTILEFSAENGKQGSASIERFYVRIEGRSLHLVSAAYGKPLYYLYKAWERSWNYGQTSGQGG